MHELSICQALMEEVTRVAREQRAVSVSDIYVCVGPLSGVEAPLLQNAFPLAAAGTVADRAQLHLEASAIRVACDACGEESHVSANRLVCERCGDWRTRVVAGDELLLRRVVLDTAAPLEAAHV